MFPLRLSLFALLLLAVLGMNNVEADDGELSIEYVGSYHTDGYTHDVTISGNYAYVVDWSEGLAIVNIEDRANPTLAGSYNFTYNGEWADVAISGNYAYAADYRGLVIVDIEDPTNPTLAGSYDTEGNAESVAISGNYAYLAANVDGLVILNIEDPANPTFVGNYTTGGYGRGVTISGNYAYVAASSNGLFIVNIEDPTNPNLVGSYVGAGFEDVTISGSYAYIAADSYGLVILNIEDPANPTFVGKYSTDGWANEVAISGNYAYVSEGYLHGLVIVDIEDPANPTFVGSYETDGDAYGVTISGNYSYVAAANGLVILATGYTPLAVIDSISPLPAEEGTTVFFNGTSSDSDGTIAAYLWKSSIDGELSMEEDFNRSDLSLGNHTITFVVQDNNGLWNILQESGNLWIYASPVAIAGQDSTGTPGVPLQFSGAGTDEDGTIAKYEWDFDGDGVFEWSSTENGLNTYIYNNEDTYTATLRVTDNDGFTDTDTVVITVTEKKIQIVDDDDGNVTVTVTDAGEDEEGIPGFGIIGAVVSIGLIARFRRR